MLPCRAVVGDFVVKGGKLRHFDEVAETIFLYDIVRNRKLEVGGFLGEYRRPRIKTVDVLPFQLLGTEIFEQQVEFRQQAQP